MNSLNDQNILCSKLHKAAMILPLSRKEIKFRHFHRLSGQEFTHILIKQFHINRFQTFEIIVSVVIQRRVLTVHKIIVQCNGMGNHSQSPKLNGQSVGKCGLSRGRRACNHNKLDTATPHNILGNFTDFPFLLCFLNQNQICQISMTNPVI